MDKEEIKEELELLTINELIRGILLLAEELKRRVEKESKPK